MTRPGALPGFLKDVNPSLAYISGVLLVLSVFALMVKRYQLTALILIANLIFWLAVTRHIYHKWSDHVNSFKSLVLIAGIFLIYSGTYPKNKVARYLIWVSLLCVCLFFEICAIAHLTSAVYVQLLIPEYIPFKLFFTYFAGVCLALGGIGLLIPKIQRPAALLSGIQITGWFLLLHIPRAFNLGDSTWIGVGESFALAGICFMMYGLLDKKTNTRSIVFNYLN